MAPQVGSVTRWKDGAAPQAWAGGRVFFNRRGASTLFDGWSALPDGSDERCETAIPAYPATTHAGISDVSPDGRWALVCVERQGDGSTDGQASAVPGKGDGNDLWLQEVGGTRAWKIRVGSLSLIWPRFSPDGTKVVWSERYYWWPFSFWQGGFRLHLADLIWSASGVPQLANIKTRNSDGLIEPYGLLNTPAGQVVVFAADSLAQLGPDAVAICTLPLTLAGPLTRLSPKLPAGSWNNYNEFCFPIPGSDRLIFARSTGGTAYSIEYWTMRADGTDAQQLTWFAKPDWPFFHGGTPSIAGALAIDPADPSRLIAGFGMDYQDSYVAEEIRLA